MKQVYIFLVALMTFGLGWSQGNESFTNLNAQAGSYGTGSFTGDDGFTWTYAAARRNQSTTDQAGTQPSIGWNTSGTRNLIGTTANGVGNISYKVRSYFTGGIASDRTIQFYLNDVLQESFTLPVMSTNYTRTFNNVNLTGNVKIEFRSTGTRQIQIDDIIWTGYAASGCTAPATQASAITFSGIGTNSMNVNWTNGNGAGRVVIMNTTNSFTAPTNGSDPSASTAYSGSGEQVVFNGTGSGPISITGLTPGETYWYRVYEFCNPDRTYNTSTETNNPNSEATTLPACTTPSAQATALNLTNITASSIDVSFTAASPAADNYLVVRSTSSTLSANPNNTTTYTVGNALGGGEVVFNGSGTSFTDSGLSQDTQYYYFVFAYNSEDCTGGPLYRTPALTGNATTLDAVVYEKIDSIAELTDGEYVIVADNIARAMNNTYNGTFLDYTTVTPVADQIIDPAASIVWTIETNGSGRTIFNAATSDYVSYTGSSNDVQVVSSVTSDNQRWNITYSSSVFFFNNVGVPARILQYNAGSPRFACYTSNQRKLHLYKRVVAECTAPTTQASNISFPDVNGTTMDVDWSNGNGAGRVVIMNTSNSFTTPTDGTDPTANTTYSGSGEQVVFNGTGSGPVTISGLTPGDTYWFRVYEYCDTDRNYQAATETGNPNSQATLNDPGITLTETTISDLDYVEGSGPSANGSFEASGANLTANIVLTAPTNFEISTNASSGFGSTINLTPSGGTVNATPIYVRLVASLTVNTYNGTLTATSTGATQQDISLSGEVTAPPPANDDCVDAIALTVGASCTLDTYSNANGTNSAAPAPSCGNYAGSDVWFSAVVPASGNLNIETAAGGITDGQLAAYSGTCGTLTLIECDDDDGPGLMPALFLTGLTPGSTIYLLFWEFGGDVEGSFDICVYEPTPSCAISSLGLANITCNDNGTPSDPSDDITSFELNPTGTDLGASYSVDMDGFANISTSISGPFTSDVISGIAYGTATTFYLEPGSAGIGGGLDFFVIDVDDINCFDIDTITDPGSCSAPSSLIFEDFDDGDFTNNPTWTGNTSDFEILTNATIPGGNASTDGLYLASRASRGRVSLAVESTEVSEWRFSLASPNFDPSSGNNFGVVLMASAPFSGNVRDNSTNFQGYFINIGVNGSTDPIELWRKTGLGEAKVGDFPASPNFGSGALENGIDIRITRSSTGEFELFYSTGFEYSATPSTSAGTLTNNTYSTSSYFGVYQSFANISASRRVYIDNIDLGQAPCITPSIDATDVNDSAVTTVNATLNWVNGNGAERIVVLRAVNDVDINPVNNSSYNANATFGNGSEIGTGNFVVYKGSGSSVTVTGLTPGTVYYAKIFEFGCAPGSEEYFTTGTPGSTSFFTVPEVPVDFDSVCLNTNTIDLAWEAPEGDFDGYLLVGRTTANELSVNTIDPITDSFDLDFSIAPTYSMATPAGRILYIGSNNTAAVTGLTIATDYTFRVYTYKIVGSDYKYSSGTAITRTTVLNNVTNANAVALDEGAFISWNTLADICYDEILVVANTTAGIDFTPTGDGSAYTANPAYAGNNSIVFKGDDDSNVDVSNLINGNTYYFEIFVRSGTNWSSGVEVSVVPADVTVFEPGDIAIIAINTSYLSSGSDDEICFIAFKDIKQGTSIEFTDNGYERVNAGQWGNTEGTIRLTYNGSSDIVAGTPICIRGSGFRTTDFEVIVCGADDNANWSFTSLNGNLFADFDLNDNDQIWILQNGTWTPGQKSPSLHNATYTGNFVWGWTASGWESAPGYASTSGSTIPEGFTCFNADLNALSTNKDKVKYTGPTTAASQGQWVTRLNDAGNWIGYANNSAYNDGPDYSGECITFVINPGGFNAGLFTGDMDNDWFDCNNWDNRKVPDVATNVTIPDGTSALINEGDAESNNLTVESTGTLTMGTGTATINSSLSVGGTLTNEGTILLNEGDTSINSNLVNQSGSNFTMGTTGTSTLGSSIIVSGTLTNAGSFLINEGGAISASVNNQSGGNFIIGSGNPDFGSSLTVNGSLTNAGTLTMQSISTAYSSLLPLGSVTNNGTIEYERHTNQFNTTPGSTTGQNDLVSPPLTGQTFGDFRADNNNLPSGTIGGVPSFLFGPYNNVTKQYVNYNSANDSGLLESGVGYRTASTNNSSLTYTGGVETGDVAVTITRPQNGNRWNLIGNPYPSYLSLDDFLVENSLAFAGDAAGIYGYDGDAPSGWTVWNNAYRDANPSAVVAPGQGFFVASRLGEPSPTVNFFDSMRRIGNSDDFIEGRSAVLSYYLKIELSAGTKKYNSEFYFNSNATRSFDVGYDNLIWGDNPPAFSLYSHLVENNTGLPLSVQSVHPNDLTGIAIPLGVNALGGDAITFRIVKSTLPEGIEVILDDTFNNSATNLNDGTYTTTHQNNANGTGRFYLGISDRPLTLNDDAFTRLHIFTPRDSRDIVVAGLLEAETSMKLYDLQGRLVLESSLKPGISEQAINAEHLNSGVYVVVLRNDLQSLKQKVILN